MSRLQKFSKEVEERGSVFQSDSSFTFDNLDDIIKRLKMYWSPEEEIIIYCSKSWRNKISNLLSSSTPEDFGTFDNLQDKALSFLCEISFYRGGYTFHVIEKPNISGAVWIPINKGVTATNCLITK